MDYVNCSVGDAVMADIANDNWINIEESAEHLGVKQGTIRDWIRKDKGVPAHKVGKLWKSNRSEVDAWIKSGKSDENK
nr:MAG TPA: DNA binding domain protein [Caudoviricetes sp.]